MLTSVTPGLGPGPMAQTQTAKDALRVRAKELKAAFLSEMLGYAGFGAARESFGGGIGEEQFGSFLRQEQANALEARGGIGLAESLFRAMSGGQNAEG